MPLVVTRPATRFGVIATKQRFVFGLDLLGKYVIGSATVELKRSVRVSVCWKSVCYAVAGETAISAVVDAYTVNCNIDSAEVVS